MNIEQAFGGIRMEAASTVLAAFNNAGTKHRRAQRYKWANSHRARLIRTGHYIKTSEPNMRKGYGREVVAEDGPELVNLRGRARVYPAPHHRGSAADVEHHWPGCGHE